MSNIRFSQSNFTYLSHPDCHPTCPWPYRILVSKKQAVSTSHITLQEASRLYESYYLLPAVNRQPWFPRGRTRRESSACPLAGPCVRFVRVSNLYHARSLLVWYKWIIERVKLDVLKKPCKIRVCEKSGAHAGPCPNQNSSKTNFLEPGWLQAGPHEKEVCKQHFAKLKLIGWILGNDRFYGDIRPSVSNKLQANG